MTKKTLQGNKLIAEFMKLSVSEGHNGLVWYDWDGAKDVLYHESWDWIMPVIKKIDEIPSEFITGSKYVAVPKKHDELIDEIRESVSFVMIMESWQAVVEFIKWYNQNSKSNE